MAAPTTHATRAECIALDPLTSPRRSIDGHFGLGEVTANSSRHVQTTNTQVTSTLEHLPRPHGDAVIEIDDNERSSPVTSTFEHIKRPGKSYE